MAGARRAADELGIDVVLVGPADQLGDTGGLEVLPASEVIAMDEDPGQGVRRKKDSSLVRAAEAVRDGRALAMVSAGNTGATMASALLRMGRLKGITRPAIATPIPQIGSHPTVLLDAGANTDTLAIVLAEQTGRSVQAVDLVLRDVQDRIAALGVGTPEEFRRVARTQEIHEFLHSRADRLPQVNDITLIGADGNRLSNSRDWPAPAGNLSDREYARHFAAQDDRGLFISQPTVNRATHVWSLYLVRRVDGPHGEYLGMVIGAVPLRVFAGLYESIDLPRSESFLLLRRDGTMLARHPDAVDRAGTKMPDDRAGMRRWRGAAATSNRRAFSTGSRDSSWCGCCAITPGDGCLHPQGRGPGALAAGSDADRPRHGLRPVACCCCCTRSHGSSAGWRSSGLRWPRAGHGWPPPRASWRPRWHRWIRAW